MERNIGQSSGVTGRRTAQHSLAVADDRVRHELPIQRRELPPREDEAYRLAAELLHRGSVEPKDLSDAQTAMRGLSLSLGQILVARGLTSEAEILSALGRIYAVGIADLSQHPPDPQLAALLPARDAIAYGAVLWRQAGSALVIATTRPDCLDQLRALLPDDTRIILALAPAAQIAQAHRSLYGRALAREAEGRAPRAHSCRTWNGRALTQSAVLLTIGAMVLLAINPNLLTVLVFGSAVAIFALNTALKFASFAASVRPRATEKTTITPFRLPTVSVLVPLHRKPEVAGALVDRLSCLDYPRERLDLILAIEEDDPLTLGAIGAGTLPPWMRVIVVPRGTPQTKPRALNYALNYARGDIIGIYDAEARPEPDQIRKIVQRFADLPPQVACLQGRLDYYNARHNWLSRLFTVEYAAWFRVLLPGVERLGLVVPLGGTTLFIRRAALEHVGAWDAHNVTEDADLGLRLARHGYVTEIADTTTFEEANAAALPWIRQRSRWLKGYLMTWGAAMQRPGLLLRELGLWRFIGVQVQFFGAVLGFLTAPLLWSFLLKPFGFWHPVDAVLSPIAYTALAAFMVFALFGSIAISIYATRAPHLRHLRPVTPLVEPYYIFGTAAAWLGVIEIAARPFFWAKTAHGRFGAVPDAVQSPPRERAARRLKAALRRVFLGQDENRND